MSSIKQCYYCGKTFEDKGGFNESPRVKASTFGQAYAVCSIKCQVEYNSIKEQKQTTNQSNESTGGSGNYLMGFILLGCTVGGIALIVNGEVAPGIGLIAFGGVANYIQSKVTGKTW
jgi:hypothetical protein